MKTVILVGTSHTIQRGSNPAFGIYIESLVSEFTPQAIAEELEKSAASVANAIATSVGIR